MRWQEKDQNQLKIYDVIRPKDVVHDTKNNMNMISVHEYVKIVWINTQTCQNLYYTLNTTWYRKKHEYKTNTRINRFRHDIICNKKYHDKIRKKKKYSDYEAFYLLKTSW